MSPSPDYYEEVVTLDDNQGRSLDCYIENSIKMDGDVFCLLLPINSPIIIMASGEEADTAEIIDDEDLIQTIFPDARAVLAEHNLTLMDTAYALTLKGELPPIEEEDIISLEVGDLEEETEEELQLIASFYHNGVKYGIYSPLTPLLFVAQEINQELELLPPDYPQLQLIVEQLLLEEEYID